MTEPREIDRFPGYDVLAKRDTPSWNEQTRRVVDERLGIAPDEHHFFDAAEWRTLRALCDRILPQPPDRAQPVPLAAMVDRQMVRDRGDGHRLAGHPPMREVWRRGLAALDAEAQRQGAAFHALPPEAQDALLRRVQQGDVQAEAWQRIDPRHFFTARVLHDIPGAYYAHPTAWSEIGFGGPASPRGYVRLAADRHDPWEAVERHD